MKGFFVAFLIMTSSSGEILGLPRPQFVEMTPVYGNPYVAVPQTQYPISPNFLQTGSSDAADPSYSSRPVAPGSINNNIINALPGFPMSPRIRAISSFGFQPQAPPPQLYSYQRPQPNSQYGFAGAPQYFYRPPPIGYGYYGAYNMNDNRMHIRGN